MAKKPKAKETMGQRLKQLRNDRGLSQPELAAVVGVPVATLRNWEQDRGMPRLDNAAKLSRALGVTLDYLATCLFPEEDR